MYYDTPELIEELKNTPPPPTGWVGFSRTWPQLAAATEYVTKNSDGTEIAVWVRGWRRREMHARAVWGDDGRLKRGTVVEYSFRDAQDEGTEIFREKITDDFELADWLMEYGY